MIVFANKGQKGKRHVGKEGTPALWSQQFWEKLAAGANYDFTLFMARAPVSPRQMQRIFHKQFGCSPEEWFREFKLRSALTLVQHGYSTKAIVHELNFSSAAYFCREFKKQYGASPKNFHPVNAGMLRDKLGHRGTESQR